MRRRDFISLALLGGASAASPRAAWPQMSRPIKLVVPFPPGGPTDIIARIVVERLSAVGQSAIVEHRPGGAGGTVGARSVAAAAPDGETLLVALVGTLTIAPTLYSDSGYDPIRSFTPVALLTSGPQVLTVNAAFPVRSLQELIAYAKSNPGKTNFASPGHGTQPHLLGAVLNRAAGIDIVHVPYRGSAPAITDLLAGQVQVMFDVTATLGPHIQTGKLRALAVTTRTRDRFHPDVPTVIEAGVPELEATVWSSVVAPAGTPANIVGGLNTAINDGLRSDTMRENLARLGLEPRIMSPQELSAFIADETRKWADVVRLAGLK